MALDAIQIALRTNLKALTCADLLGHGWTYKEELNQPSRWESPIASLQVTPNSDAVSAYNNLGRPATVEEI